MALTGTWAIIKEKGHQHRWLAGVQDLEIGHSEVDSMVVSCWIMAFLPNASTLSSLCSLIFCLLSGRRNSAFILYKLISFMASNKVY